MLEAESVPRLVRHRFGDRLDRRAPAEHECRPVQIGIEHTDQRNAQHTRRDEVVRRADNHSLAVTGVAGTRLSQRLNARVDRGHVDVERCVVLADSLPHLGNHCLFGR